jgi:RNA polymerase sigma factor (sigma-70 family)
MSESGWAALLYAISARYDEIKAKLARSLGSRDLADEVMHETYLRLRHTEVVGAIQKPDAYIFRTALNIATDKRREANRRASLAEVLAVTQLDDDMRDLSREMEARLQVEVLKLALAELPPRRRAIFVAARVDGISHEEIARRLNLSRTMVQKELRRAIDHCLDRLGENDGGGELSARRRQTSYE